MDGALNMQINNTGKAYSLIDHIAPVECLASGNFKILQETATLAPNHEIEIKDPETQPMTAVGFLTGYGHAVNPSRKHASVLKMM